MKSEKKANVVPLKERVQREVLRDLLTMLNHEVKADPSASSGTLLLEVLGTVRAKEDAAVQKLREKYRPVVLVAHDWAGWERQGRNFDDARADGKLVDRESSRRTSVMRDYYTQRLLDVCERSQSKEA